MKLDDTISKINSINHVTLEERLRIKSNYDKAIKEGYLPIHGDFMTGEINIKSKVWLTVEEAKLMLEALLRLPTEGNKAILKKTLIPLKERIEQVEKEI